MVMQKQNKVGELRYIAMSSDLAEAYRAGAPDAHGNPAEQMVSDGSGYPCRHCLRDIEKGKVMLLFAWRPFATAHAYAETGPVFLCGEACSRHEETSGLPQVISIRPRFMICGYDNKERIVEGSGQMIDKTQLEKSVRDLMEDNTIASVHVRSGTNTCYTCRIERR